MKSFMRRGYGVLMVVATITLVGLVGFRFVDVQDNREVARTPEPQQIAKVQTVEDIQMVTNQLDTAELDAIDAELADEFDF